jgi:hypothetical protein
MRFEGRLDKGKEYSKDKNIGGEKSENSFESFS